MKDQCYEMATKLAELRRVLDVYRGMFELPEDAAAIAGPFPEIAGAIRKSLSVHLLSGCAALFTDPAKTNKDENMSFQNLIANFPPGLPAQAQTEWAKIEAIAAGMNLKGFRNKYVAHFGLLEHLIDAPAVEQGITSEKLHELLVAGESLINLIIRIPGVYQPGTVFTFYQPIPASRSTAPFLRQLSRI